MGLSAKISLDTVSTPTSVVKPKVCIRNLTPSLLGDIYCYMPLEHITSIKIINDYER